MCILCGAIAKRQKVLHQMCCGPENRSAQRSRDSGPVSRSFFCYRKHYDQKTYAKHHPKNFAIERPRAQTYLELHLESYFLLLLSINSSHCLYISPFLSSHTKLGRVLLLYHSIILAT